MDQYDLLNRRLPVKLLKRFETPPPEDVEIPPHPNWKDKGAYSAWFRKYRETPEAKTKRLKRDVERQRNRTPEQRNARLEYDRQYYRKRMRHE